MATSVDIEIYRLVGQLRVEESNFSTLTCGYTFYFPVIYIYICTFNSFKRLHILYLIGFRNLLEYLINVFAFNKLTLGKSNLAST